MIIKKIDYWIYLLILIGLYGVGVWYYNPQFLTNDAFFHFRLSALFAEQGLVRSLPQIDNMAWGQMFVDKEILFHLFTSAFYYFFKESGVKFIVFLFYCGIIVALFEISLTLTRQKFLAFLLSILVLTYLPFFYRMTYLRPHSLSILIFLLNILALIKDKKWLFWASCFLHPLSYHFLLIIPFNLFLISLLYPQKRKMVSIGVAAFLLGIFVHPYFPGNLLIFQKIIKISLKLNPVHPLFLPNEFLPMDFPLMGPLYIEFLLLLLITMVPLYFKKRKGEVTSLSKNREVVFFLLLMTPYLVLMLKNSRTIEYFFPCLILGLASLIGLGLDLGDGRQDKKKANGTLLVLIFHCCNISTFTSVRLNTDYEKILNSLKIIPANFSSSSSSSQTKVQQKVKVYNCSWDLGEYIFYARPDLKLVDLLDPSFLSDEHPYFGKLKESLAFGQVFDPYAVLKNVFEADYVFCDIGNLNLQLDQDPRFKRLYPGTVSYREAFKGYDYLVAFQVAIYQVLPEKDDLFIKKFQLSSSEARELVLSKSYLTMRDFKREGACTLLKVPSSELAKKQGAQILGLGGSANSTVYWNGKKIEKETRGSGNQGPIHRLLLLPRFLQKGDRIEVKICHSSPGATFALSIWGPLDIRDYCLRNEKMEVYPAMGKRPSLFHNLSLNVCQEFQSLKKRFAQSSALR